MMREADVARDGVTEAVLGLGPWCWQESEKAVGEEVRPSRR